MILNKQNQNHSVIPLANKDTINTFWQLLIRVGLFSLAAFGTSFTFADIYDLPIYADEIFLFSFIVTPLLSVLFLFVKGRYGLPFIFVIGWYLLRDLDFYKYFSHFSNYFLYKLDGRLLYTAGFTTMYSTEIKREFLIPAVFALFFLISVIYALSLRAKFVGVVLISVVLLLLPAFAAEIVYFVPGFYPLAISMAGIYGMWVSHEMSMNTPLKSKKSGFLKKFMPALPPIRTNAINGLALSLIAAVSVGIGDYFIGNDDSGINKVIKNLQEKILYAADYLPSYFYNKDTIEDNGYFSNSILRDNSTYIHLNAPNTSTRPVLSVTKSMDNIEPLFLKGTICIDYNSDAQGWSVYNKSRELSDLESLIDEFYPEIEYMLYAQRINPLIDHYSEFIRIDNIYIEYLLNTKVVFTPPALFLPSYKDNEFINYSLDTVLRSKKFMDQDAFTSLYVVKSEPNFGTLWEYANNAIIREYPSEDGEFLVVEYHNSRISIPFNDYSITPTEYIFYKQSYEELINKIYTNPSKEEELNIKRLRSEIYNTENNFYNRKDELNQYDFVTELTNYFKSGRYEYSLTTDNLTGDNTMLGNFLFETRSGHCALYATALTLLLRDEGIPARYVTGYVINGGGVPNDNQYIYTILERDLHGWVEVYFDNLGWVSFDPTPPIVQNIRDETVTTEVTPAETPPTEPVATETTPQTDITAETEETAPYKKPNDNTLSFIIIIASSIFSLLVISATVFFLCLSKKEKSVIRQVSHISSKDEAKRTIDFIMKLLSVENLTPELGELPSEFAERIAQKVNFPKSDRAADIIEITEKLEFSKAPLTGEEYNTLSEYTLALYNYSVLSKKIIKRTLIKITVLL